MCVLCRDTFSRSDILKRHFQKCSVRRGNPTGASHLSNPAAHLKKSQASATAEAKSNANSPITGTTSSGQVSSQNATANGTMSSASSHLADTPGNPFPMGTTTPNSLHRSASHQNFNANSSINASANGAWTQMQHAPRPNNASMYNSASASPHHFGLGASSAEEKRNALAPSAGEDWNHIFQSGESQDYMFPTSMSGTYDGMHSQVEVKKEYDQGAAASNNYYVTPTTLGADGTLGPSLWNLDASQDDSLQLKGDRLVDFCFLEEIQDSLQEQQNNANLRACLTADNLRHFPRAIFFAFPRAVALLAYGVLHLYSGVRRFDSGHHLHWCSVFGSCFTGTSSWVGAAS
jgi:hypothetical protein